MKEDAPAPTCEEMAIITAPTCSIEVAGILVSLKHPKDHTIRPKPSVVALLTA